MKKVKDIVNRISSQHFARLWQFYREIFNSDDECLQFFHDALSGEPEFKNLQYIDADNDICYVDSDGDKVRDSVFVPRRMLNAVERMVLAARDMEMIRRGKDVFKIVYIVTCVETLQKLAGRDKDERGQNISKKNLLFNFFEKYTLEADKQYIACRFKHNEERVDTQEDSFKQFVGVINEYRNCAAHEGDYWTYCFNNSGDGYPLVLEVKIDLDKYSGSDEKKKKHSFTTEISYSEFERIFIRTCVTFIKRYVEGKQDAN